MSHHLIPIWIANAEYEAEAILNQNPVSSLSWKQALGICERFQVMAVGYYLLQSNINAFKQNLIRSVDFYLSYLDASDQRPPTSRVMAFVHAVILDRVADAQANARQSRQSWFQGYEYQDDMLFMRFLMAWVDQKSQSELESLVTQISEFETDKNRHLIAVCKALPQKSEQDFKQALEGYLDFHCNYYRKGFEKDVILEQEYRLYRKVSLVGIALYKLGKNLAFQLEAKYRGIPPLLTQLSG